MLSLAWPLAALHIFMLTRLVCVIALLTKSQRANPCMQLQHHAAGRAWQHQPPPPCFVTKQKQRVQVLPADIVAHPRLQRQQRAASRASRRRPPPPRARPPGLPGTPAGCPPRAAPPSAGPWHIQGPIPPPSRPGALQFESAAWEALLCYSLQAAKTGPLVDRWQAPDESPDALLLSSAYTRVTAGVSKVSA